MGTRILFTSGKGGTGKTTATAAIASCLAALGHRTLCIDCDVGLNNLDISLGMPFSNTSFYDVLEKRMTLEEAVCAHPSIENLFFLAAPASLQPDEIAPAQMENLLQEAKASYDFCLLDSAAGLGSGFRLASAAVDQVVLVTTADRSSVRDGQRAAAMLYEKGYQSVFLLVNRVHPKLVQRSGLTVDDLIDSVGAKLIGLVAEDPTVPLAANLEKPLVLVERRHAAAQFLRIARRLAGEQIPLGKL